LFKDSEQFFFLKNWWQDKGWTTQYIILCTTAKI